MTKTPVVLTACFFALLLQAGSIRSFEQAPHDAYGDSLPPGATARFGSLRWRLPDAINGVAISSDGKQVAAVNMHGKVAVWEKESGKLLHDIWGSKTGEACLAFSPDGKSLATGGRFDNSTGTGDYRVRIW